MLHRSRTRISRVSPQPALSPSIRTTPMPGRLVRSVAAAWMTVRWLWCGIFVLALGALALAAMHNSLPSGDPLGYIGSSRNTLPGWTDKAATALWALALISVCTFAAYRADLVIRARALAPHVIKPVRKVNPSAYIPRYVDGVYLYRDDAVTGRSADDAARAALYTAAAHRHGKSHRWTLGICVYGRPTQGKSRLAWEAMRAALPGWTFVQWRHRVVPLDLTALRGRSVALWLDDLHEYANSNEAVILNDMPARLEAAGARVVVVATCRDGEEEIRACKYLESLIERLTPIRITNISDDDADQLVAALAKRGVLAPRENFARTPGSILLDVAGMRSQHYPALPEDAKRALRALKLLRSARIYTYPAERVRATAIDVFGLPPAAWPSAIEAVTRADFVRWSMARPAGERMLEPTANVYIDMAVPDYLNPNAEPGDDWPWLQESLERHGDGEALLALGNAYAEQRPGVGPFLPSDPAISRLQAVMCFRAALDVFTRDRAPYCWAVTQANLAAALTRLAELTQGIQRTDLRRQSSAAYRAALEIFTRDTDPASWALTQFSLAELFYRRAADAVYLGDARDACDYLRQAWRYVECAMTVYTRADDPAHHRQVAKLRSSILTAMRELNCPAGDDDGGDVDDE